MKTLRILTTVHLANPGACLFTETLANTLQEGLPNFDVRVLNYLPRNWYFYELARAIKPNPELPLLNIQRYLKSEQFHREHLKLEKNLLLMPIGYNGMVNFLNKQSYDALVVGMVVWDIVKKAYIPKFPNIYWLSEKISAVKIAYAASGHRTNLELFRKDLPKIRRTLNSFSLIGVRDNLTYRMMREVNLEDHIPVLRVPDPAFLYDIKSNSISEFSDRFGIDASKPIVGFIFHGNDHLAEQLANYFHSKGCQIISLSMYNPRADFNLAHVLSPHEWANTFPLMSFCITDRFHGTIMCLKSKIPFISIEPYKPTSQGNSKIYSLLKDFEMLDCYINEYDEHFTGEKLFKKIEFISANWESSYKSKVKDKLNEVDNLHFDFQQKIRNLFES